MQKCHQRLQIVFALVVSAFKGPITKWFKQVIDSWFNTENSTGNKINGYYDNTVAPTNAVSPWNAYTAG